MYLSLFFIFISEILFLSGLERSVKHSNLAEQLLIQRNIPIDTKKLVKVAKKMDYQVKPGTKHLLVKIRDQKGHRYIITTIPHHIHKKNTARGILIKLRDNYHQ